VRGRVVKGLGSIRGSIRGWAYLLVIAGACLVGPITAAAQTVAAPEVDGQGKDGSPIEITANEGIEWFRDAKQYRARGAATATRGALQVTADTLIAYYRGGEDGERQVIFRLDAVGDVTITSPDGIAYGDKGVYHVEKQVAVLVGTDLRLITDNATITAQESLEYWEARSLAVARGDALVTREDQRVKAGVLTAFIISAAERAQAAPSETGDDNPLGGGEVNRIDATGGVHVSTKTEIVTGREGIYDVANERITLCGKVKITRGDNQLNGECAIVNMKTGRSRLEGRGTKVEGLILPTQ
jgi:lipopolysaccharide export system protein LptA